MKKSLIIVSCFIVVILTSLCIHKRPDNDIFHINIETCLKNMETVNISQYSKKILYVPLQGVYESPLIWQTTTFITVSENFMIETDRRICMLYDKKGNFIRQIGQTGRGPGEYLGISYISLINDKIFVHDYYTDDLIEFRLDGTFLKRHITGFTAGLNYRIMDGYMINDSMILGSIENISGREKYKAVIFNKEGNIKNLYSNYTFFNLEPGVRRVRVPGKSIMHKFNGEVFFKEFLNDTLFKFDKSFSLIPKYILTLGKFKEPNSARGKSWNQQDLLSYIDLDDIFQTNNLLILKCDLNKNFPAKRNSPEIIRMPGREDYTQLYNTTSIIGIFDKRTGNLIFSEPSNTDNHLSTSGLFNDIDAGPRFIPGKMVNDSTMVMKIRFDYLVKHIESTDFKNNNPMYPERKKKLKEFVDSLQKAEFDNPVYMFVTFEN